MDHHEEAICLARTEKGLVKICPPGCTHVTFGGLTLDFDSPGHFQEMAENLPKLLEELEADQAFAYSHGEITLEFSQSDAVELGQLVSEASATIAWSSGEMEFSDEDFRQILKRLSP